eukprot:scaffold63450_cov59-Phaeocystis_antarctica.AAC.5
MSSTYFFSLPSRRRVAKVFCASQCCCHLASIAVWSYSEIAGAFSVASPVATARGPAFVRRSLDASVSTAFRGRAARCMYDSATGVHAASADSISGCRGIVARRPTMYLAAIY